MRDVLIPETNKEMSGDEIILQELYVYLGCHFCMACFEGISDWRLWWSPKPVSIREVSTFWLQKCMELHQFISSTSVTRFKNNHSPSFLDRFHDVQQMIKKFNEHYLENYTPSWLSCLDESIKYFLYKFCPGFMSVTRKPHSLGNCYQNDEHPRNN